MKPRSGTHSGSCVKGIFARFWRTSGEPPSATDWVGERTNWW